MDHAMFDALLRAHQSRVTEAQLPAAVLCHLYASSKGAGETSPRQFLAFPPPEEVVEDPDVFADSMRDCMAKHNAAVEKRTVKESLPVGGP